MLGERHNLSVLTKSEDITDRLQKISAWTDQIRHGRVALWAFMSLPKLQRKIKRRRRRTDRLKAIDVWIGRLPEIDARIDRLPDIDACTDRSQHWHIPFRTYYKCYIPQNEVRSYEYSGTSRMYENWWRIGQNVEMWKQRI